MFSKKVGIMLAAGILVSAPLSNVFSIQDKTLNNSVAFQMDPNSNQPRMLHSKTDSAIPFQIKNNESVADAVKRNFAPAFGINDPVNELVVKKEFAPSVSRQTIRYQQQYQGIPVLGGELVANVNNQQLTSMSGEVAKVTLTDLSPDINAEQAIEIAKAAVAKWYSLDVITLLATKPQLTIYDPSLLSPSTAPQALTWKLSVTPSVISAVNEFVLVDANRGAIVLHFNQVDSALNRETYTANGLQIVPGTLVCNESDPTCAAGDTDAQLAHRYAGDTYNFYFNNHNRDSLDGAGMTLRSTVHFGDLSNFQNAAWLGEPYNQMIYGAGFPAADDVVSHELTHGVTDNTSELFYYYQSGAINESLSDVWGEFVDLTNSSGNDAAGVRWELGEDVPIIGTVRDMADPNTFGDPAYMTDPLYYSSSGDNGGVHHNSGINNKAVTLMVDGGSFNGQTITGIGITKVAKIYYEVQTNYLLSGSDYLDLYNALNQACQNLIGSAGITASDCTQVQNAALAVEMNQEPAVDFNPDAEICPAGSIPNDLRYYDYEVNLSGWTSNSITGTNPWVRGGGYATSGYYSAGIVGTDTTHQTTLTLSSAVSVPATGTYYIHFNQVFDFEFFGATYYDGGVIEYSTNGGTTWLDASSLIDNGRDYTGTLTGTNPLGARQAFVGSSHGYNSTRLNLTTLAGMNVLFRFYSAADNSVASAFWIVDDFRVYSCVTNGAPTANAGSNQDVNANTVVNLNGSASTDPDMDALTYQWTQMSGTTVSLTGANTATPSFTTPNSMATLIFRLIVTDTAGQSDPATVTVTVNGPPTANAGTDQNVALSAAVTLNGSGTDPEGNPVTYSWAQTGGTSVTLSSTNTASTSFTAPAAAATLTFQLTVTDDRSQTATDSVTVNVGAPAGGGGGGGCSVNANGRFDPLWLTMLLLLSVVHLRRRNRI